LSLFLKSVDYFLAIANLVVLLMDFFLLFTYLELEFIDAALLTSQLYLFVLNLTSKLLNFLFDLGQLVASDLKFSFRLKTHV
jgi:hypothetical protein